jgi:putative oxidoreductase
MIDFLSSLNALGDWGLLVLRLALAAIFLYHAKAKIGGAMGGFMRFIGICECAGGLAMLFGFLTQLAAIGIGIIMIGAMWKKLTEWHVPFWSQSNTGWEFDMLILAVCVALLVMGGGPMAVDRVMWGI